MLTVRQRISNFLSKYFVGCGCGVVRMNNAIGQFQNIVTELNTAVEELTDQRAAYDAEMNMLQDKVDRIRAMKTEAGENIGRAVAVRNRIAGLIGE